VLEKIKGDSELKKIPIIMLTTSSNPKDIDKAYKLHCNSYVKKPINMDEFFKAIIKIEQFWLQELKKIPIIMLTTSSNPKDINKAYKLHCNSYVKKPINMDEFFKAIIKIEQFWLQLTSLAE